MSEQSVLRTQSTRMHGLPAIRMNFELEGKRIGHAHVMHEGGEIVVRHVHIESLYIDHPYAAYAIESLKRTADAIVVEDPSAMERGFWLMMGFQVFGGRILFWRSRNGADEITQ